MKKDRMKKSSLLQYLGRNKILLLFGQNETCFIHGANYSFGHMA